MRNMLLSSLKLIRQRGLRQDLTGQDRVLVFTILGLSTAARGDILPLPAELSHQHQR